MGWTVDPELVEKARANGRLTSASDAGSGHVFTVETWEGVEVAEADTLEGARLGCKTNLREGYPGLLYIVVDGNGFHLEAWGIDEHGNVVGQTSDASKQYEEAA
jgi:hypothetical protein